MAAVLAAMMCMGVVRAEKPNILWIVIEDTSPHFIGCYGDQDARTPNIDRLACEGIRFTNAYSTGAVCSPSRSTIITGVKTYKLGTGNHRSAYPIPEFMKGFPFYMQQAGYFASNNSKTDYNIANAPEFIKEAWSAQGKVGWWNRTSEQPFFSVFNYNDSHQSRTMSFSWDRYENTVLKQLSPEQIIGDDQFSMPPFLKDSPEMRKQFARVYNSIRLVDRRIGEVVRKLEDDGLRESTIIFFYGDHGEGIPRGKQNGVNLSYQVPFIVWVPEKFKHLSPWGTGGVVVDELVSFEDLAPTVISLAGGTIPEHMKGRVLMGENRSKPTDHLLLSTDRTDTGIDLMRAVTDGKYLYARNFMSYLPEERYKSYSEIADIMKQMRKDLAAGELNELQESLFVPREPEFLFDLENDPWETVNLAKEPVHQERLKKMRGLLEAEVLSARDVLFLPEYEVELISAQTTPYEFRMDDKKYPIAEIHKAASLSGFRGADVARRQVELLKSPNRVVRYWAAIGLLAQNRSDLEPFKKSIAEAMDDSYPPAAVTASAVMWMNFEKKAAEKKIKEYLAFDNWYINLMAVDYLLYAETKEPFKDEVAALSSRYKGRGIDRMQERDVTNACEIFFNIL